MKFFLTKLLKFILPLIILFFGLSFLLKKVIKNHADFSLNKNYTTIILGHSEPEGAFNDSLIENTINLCNGGEAYLYSYQKLKNVVEHNPQIKTVIISFSNNQIEKKMDDWTYDDEHLDQYFAKYNFDMTMADYRLVIENNFKGVLRAELKSLIQNSKTVLRRKNMFANNNFGGYLYLKRNKVDSLIQHNYIDTIKKQQTKEISQINIDYLKKIVSFCKEKNIKLYFVRTPIHPVLFAILDENKFQNIINENFDEIPFLDTHSYPLTNDEFGDFTHLNYKGAKRFSNYFNTVNKDSLANATIK